MPGSVIIRGETIYEGDTFRHDDTPLSWAEADERAGLRLDRRKSWAFVEGELCEAISWTGTCSGCSCDCGCYGEHGASGCRECGYTGKRRNGQWLPAGLASGMAREAPRPKGSGSSELPSPVGDSRGAQDTAHVPPQNPSGEST